MALLYLEKGQMQMNTDQEIDHLFRLTEVAFDKSPIKKLAKARNTQWSYSICSTRITSKATLIVGFNWGASGNERYAPQTTIPTDSFKDLFEKRWLNSLQRVYKPLQEFLPSEEVENCVQTNFCFFRSKKEQEITSDDLKLSTPLFHNFVEIIQPARIIGFSSKLRDYLTESDNCSELFTDRIRSNNRTIHVAKGIYHVDELKIPICFLPHPNAKFTTQARNAAWRFCLG